MDLANRINQWVLRRILGKTVSTRLIAKPEGLQICRDHVSDVTIMWSDISRIVVMTRDTYVPSDFRTLLVEWGGDHSIQLHEEMAGWKTLPDAIDRFLPGAAPSAQWLLELQAATKRPLTIYVKQND